MKSNIWKYCAYHGLMNFQLWAPIWVIYLTDERNLTLAQVTIIDVPFLASMILFQVPAAAIADRWGRKPILVFAGVLMALAIALFALAASFWLILASYLLWGIAYSFLFGTESAFLYDTLAALKRGNEYSRFYGLGWAVATAATLGGTLLGAPLAALTSLSFSILMSGAVAGLAALLALTFHEPERSVELSKLTYAGIMRESVRSAKDEPRLRYPIMFYGLLTIGSVGPMFFFQPFLIQHDVDVGLVGIWQTPMRVAGVVGAIYAYRVVQQLGERLCFCLMLAALVASFVLLGAWDSLYAQVAFSVMNLVVVMSQPIITEGLNRNVLSANRATVVSLTNLSRSAVLIPTTPLLGALASEYSLSTAFFAGGVLIAGFGVPLLLAWRPSGQKPTRQVDLEAS